MGDAHETQVTASEFKARCLGLLESVERTGIPLVVTRRGRPVVRVVPVGGEAPRSLLGSASWASEEDLLAPTGEYWDADR